MPFEPCGQIVDYLRSCYYTNIRPYWDNLLVEVPIYWFWTIPGAQILELDTPFRSRNWDDRDYTSPLGEASPYPRAYFRGTWPGNRYGLSRCGTALQWHNGASITDPVPLILAGGRPICCVVPLMSLIVQDVSGMPSYSDVGIIKIDQALGLILSQPADNQVELELRAATKLLAGVVTTVDQEFSGGKTFWGSLIITDQVRLEAPGLPGLLSDTPLYVSGGVSLLRRLDFLAPSGVESVRWLDGDGNKRGSLGCWSSGGDVFQRIILQTYQTSSPYAAGPYFQLGDDGFRLEGDPDTDYWCRGVRGANGIMGDGTVITGGLVTTAGAGSGGSYVGSTKWGGLE